MVQALFNGNDFDFAECACGKILNGEAASCRFAREVFCIDFVKGGKVFHVCEEAGRFYHIINGEFYHAYSAPFKKQRTDPMGSVLCFKNQESSC